MRKRHRNIRYARQAQSMSVYSSFQALLHRSFWIRHPEPFSKTRKGKLRRAERLFVRSMDQPTAYVPLIQWPNSENAHV